MKKVNISSININLLNVLNTLFKERNTTRAAKKLGISQPAVSHSLKKLREIFNDDLLVKPPNSKKLQLTQFAKTLQHQVEETVVRIQSVLNFKDFDPSNTKRKFKIALTDYCACLLLSDLYMKLREIAPQVSIETFPFDLEQVQNQIELNEIDIAIGEFLNIPSNKNIFYKHLFKDKIVCTLSSTHPLLAKENKLSFENFAKYPSLIINPFYKQRIGYKELELKKFEDKMCKNQNLVTHNSTMVFQIIRNTDLISLIPMKIKNVKAFDTEGITMLETDFFNSVVNISLCYNKVAKADKGIMWLIKTIEEITKNLD